MRQALIRRSTQNLQAVARHYHTTPDAGQLPPALVSFYDKHPVDITEGRGVFLYDRAGKQYVDFHTNYSATPFGHRPDLFALVWERVTSGKVPMRHGAFPNPEAEEAAQKLADKTAQSLGEGERSVYFTNTGAEAVESGLKFARKWGADSKGIPESIGLVYAYEGCFHGRAMGGTSLFDPSKPIRQRGFGPLVPGIGHLPWNNPAGLERLKQEGFRTAAVILEPIQGEGGINPMDPNYARQLQEICKQQEILIIADEIQAGLHRSGSFWASEGVLRPNIILSAKALGGGIMPVAAVIMDEQVRQHLKPGMHGSTFGGNPLAVALANRTLDLMDELNIADHVAQMSPKLEARLEDLAKRYPEIITGVKGQGLWRGIALASDLDTHKVCETLIENGIITGESGAKVLRMAPPLNITEQELDIAMEALEKGVQAVREKRTEHMTEKPGWLQQVSTSRSTEEEVQHGR